MDKSYVTMEVCVICQEDTGSLFLDRRLRPKFDMKTSMPWSVCDKCKKKYLTKGVLIINPKTGRLVVLKKTAFKRIFNKPIPKGNIVYAEEKVLDFLQHGQ